MTKQIVIVGATPLCLFLAELLDESVARLVHADVRWLTTAGQIVPLSLGPTVLGAHPLLTPKKIDHVRIGKVSIKSISLADKRIITDKGVLNYDWLLIDQGQSLSDVELKIVRGEVKKLMASLQASINTKQKTTAAITVNGAGVAAAQLLLALAHDLRQYPAIWRRVELVASDLKLTDSGRDTQATKSSGHSRDYRLESWLKTADIIVGSRKTDRPGLKITTTKPLIANQKIRGLRIDRAGRAITNASGQLEKFPEVTILDSSDRPWQSLLRFEQTLAKKIAKNIERIVEGEPSRPLELHGRAAILSGEKLFVELGAVLGGGWRSKAVLGLDRSFLKRRSR